MQGLIDCGKYKVTEVLSSHSGFEAALCSDVTVTTGRRRAGLPVKMQ